MAKSSETTTQVQVRIPDGLLEAIDEYQGTMYVKHPTMSRNQAILSLIAQGLAANGIRELP